MNTVMKFAAILVFISILKYSTPALITDKPKSGTVSHEGSTPYAINKDEPLFLTPFIENGDVETGRTLSRVGQLPNAPSVPSYSGFFTVNKEYNSNLFFWFFPALNNDTHAPVILWLQGGPGASGLLALFVEHGPYILYSNTTAGLRNYTWAKEFNVLYVDNPVGAGFSFTDDEKGYSTNQDQITDNLYEFLRQFFEVYDEYGSNDLYISGESYGGKHVPYLGHKLHTDGPPAKVNFKGISIGNGFFDVQGLMGHAELFYQLNIIDENEAATINATEDSILQNVQKGNYTQALIDLNKCYGFFQYPANPSPSYVVQKSGYSFLYNLLNHTKPEDYLYQQSYIQSPQSRRAIHVGNLTFHNQYDVQRYLAIDNLASSSRGKLASLMDNDYKVLVYSGHLDLAIPTITTQKILRDLAWKRRDDYNAVERKLWRMGGYVAGYVKSVGNFSFINVRDAGHLVPRDQPEVAFDLITRFINDVPYF